MSGRSITELRLAPVHIVAVLSGACWVMGLGSTFDRELLLWLESLPHTDINVDIFTYMAELLIKNYIV